MFVIQLLGLNVMSPIEKDHDNGIPGLLRKPITVSEKPAS